VKAIFRRRPTPAMGIALVALFVALSGTAVALPGKNSVQANDLKRGSVGTRAISNNSVRSGDIRTGNVRSSDVLNDSLLSQDVQNNALTGDDINESTLGTVPSANNANTVGNRTPAQLRSTAAFAENGTVIASLGTSFVTVVSTTINTQSTGLVQANGSAELVGATSLAEGRCRILIDGVGGVNLEGANDDVGVPDPYVISLGFARTVAAGNHTVAMQCQSDTGAPNNTGKDDATLTVTGTPTP